METITLKIDKRSKAGKALDTILKLFAMQPGVEIVTEKSPYNPEFVKKVKHSAAGKKRYRVENVDKLWESL